jgi:parvulin-like peptidyl-prolyl isomerase
MAGKSQQIQVRHILVDKKEIAELLKETLEAAKSDSGRIKMLMSLAQKYSQCPSKDDGGNLGWVEVGWDAGDSRNPRGGYKPLTGLRAGENQ